MKPIQRHTALSRCARSIEQVVVSADRLLTTFDVYRVLSETDQPVSLSTIRRGLQNLHLQGRIHCVKLPRTGRCLYSRAPAPPSTPPSTSSSNTV